MKIVKIDNPEAKSGVCEKIIRALPAWFGTELAILNYIKDVQSTAQKGENRDGRD